MAPTLAQSAAARHRLLPERVGVSLKADLRKAEERNVLAEIGAALDEARHVLRWSLKELTGEIETATGHHRDERQIARWIAGTERQQFDVLFSVEALREPLVIALARHMTSATVTTTITVRTA